MCIEIHKKFDVAEVSTDVAEKLRKHELTIRGIQSKAIYEIGEELKAAHDELADYHGGVFVAWCDSIGYNPMQVKRILDYHDFVLTNCENRTLIESLPKSLIYEAGKKSAPKKLTQKVLAGEITTHKQWQEEKKALQQMVEEAEQRARQAEQTNETLTEQFDEQAEELQSLKDNPQIVEVTKAPADYDYLKQSNEDLKRDRESYARANDNLRRQLAELQAHNEGMSLQEKAKDDEAFREYMKTKHQEAEDADTFDRAISKLDMLPDNMEEVKEYCRCYLSHHATEANRSFLMKSTAQKIRLNIKKLEAALEMFEQGKLSVVK